MKARTTIILAVITLGLLIYLFRVELRAPTTDEAKSAGEKVFGGADFSRMEGGSKKGLSDLVTKIELQRGDSTLVLERRKKDDKKTWQIVKPIDRRADDSEVSGLLSELEFLRRDEGVKAKDGNLDLAQYGLDKPEATVKFWLDDKSWSLLVGKGVSIGRKVYVKRGDEADAVVTSDTVAEKTKKELNDFRDKSALRTEKDKVTAATLLAAGKPEISCRKEKGGWQILSPLRDLASRENVERLIDDVKDLRIDAKDFVTDDDRDLAKYGLDKPAFTVTLREEDTGRSLLFGAAKDKDKVYAMRAGESTVFLLKSDDMKKADKALKDLRSDKALAFTVDDATRLDIKVAGEEAQAVKENNVWKVVKPEAVDADKTQVENYLRELTELKVQEWIDEPKEAKEYGLDQPLAALTVTFKGDAAATLKVGAVRTGEAKGIYVRRGDEGPVLVVDEKLQKKARAGHLALLPRKVLNFTKDEAEKMEIQRGTEKVTAKREGDEWKLLNPVAFDADKNAVNDALWDLSWLEAKELVERKPKDLEEYGLKNPSIQVTVLCQEKEKAKDEKKDGDAKDKDKDKDKKEEPKKKAVEYVLLVGKPRGEDGSFGMVQGKDMVFLLDPNVLKRLKAEFARRKVLKLKSDDVQAVTIAYAKPEKKTVRFERDGDKWKMTEPEQRTADRDKVNDVVNTMAELNAESIIEYAPANLAQYGLDDPSTRLTADLKDGKKAEILLGEVKDDKRFAKGSDAKFVYRITRDDAARLEKEKPEPPKPPEAPDAKPEDKPKTEAPATPEAKPADKPAAQTPAPPAKPADATAEKAQDKPAPKPEAKPAETAK